MSTLDSCVKDYPPDEHILSHESNPLAAGVSVVKQKIKDDASQSNSKPSQIVNNAVSSTNVLTGLHVGTQRALKQIIHVSNTQ